MGKRIVIALGGNALGKTISEQAEVVKGTAKAIAGLILAGHQVVISHGNGPQVGMIQKSMTALHKQDPEHYELCPLSVCTAMSQGYIGLDLQRALRNELRRSGIHKPITTILTQIQVDPEDEAITYFQLPDHPSWEIVAAYRKGHYISKPARTLIELAGNYFYSCNTSLAVLK